MTLAAITAIKHVVGYGIIIVTPFPYFHFFQKSMCYLWSILIFNISSAHDPLFEPKRSYRNQGSKIKRTCHTAQNY